MKRASARLFIQLDSKDNNNENIIRGPNGQKTREGEYLKRLSTHNLTKTFSPEIFFCLVKKSVGKLT